MKNTSNTFVYIIKNGEGKFKIGRSINPDKRLKQLQTANNSKLKLIAQALGDIYLEKRLHKMFFLRKERGEWFALSPEALDLLIDYLKTRYKTVVY